MKKCPQCSRTYPDDTLAFCLEDGALLSASYNPQETQTPTVAINAGEVPTVVANEIPTIVAPMEVPTVFNPPRVTEVAEASGVQWYIYLLGFALIFIISFTLRDYIFESIMSFANYLSDGALRDYMIANTNSFLIISLIFRTILSLIFYGALALILGFIWSGAKWKWGIVVSLLDLYLTGQYIIFYMQSYYSPLIIGEIIKFVFIILFACLCSYLGSRLKNRRRASV